MGTASNHDQAFARTSVVMLADVDLGRADATRTHVTEIAQGFARAGREVELVARGPDPHLAGVRFHDAQSTGPGKLRRIAGMNRMALRVLVRSRGRSRLVYYRYDTGLVGAVIASRLLGYRAVAEMNDVRFGPGFAGRTDGVRARVGDLGKVGEMRVAARVTARFVTVTAGIKQIIVQRYSVPADRVQVLPNGVDIDRFHVLERRPACDRAGLDPAGRYVVFVGLLAGWVDFPVLMRAFALVAADRPDARLVIVGDGPERGLVESLRDDLGLGDRVIMTGFLGDRDLVSQYVGAATVCVMAHRAAMLDRIGVSPVKLAEYLAAGRAIVGLDIPGAREVLETSGGGVSVPPDPSAMATAIGELLDDPERADALGRSGRLAAEGTYSWSSVVRRTLDVIDDAA